MNLTSSISCLVKLRRPAGDLDLGSKALPHRGCLEVPQKRLIPLIYPRRQVCDRITPAQDPAKRIVEWVRVDHAVARIKRDS